MNRNRFSCHDPLVDEESFNLKKQTEFQLLIEMTVYKTSKNSIDVLGRNLEK